MMLELKNVSKSYGKNEIIKDMNVTFKCGIYGILGVNGAGKSTTIRLISTVEKPDCGEILFNNQDIYELGEEYRKRIGYVAQKGGYYPEFTVNKFLYYIAELKGIQQKESVINSCLKKVDLTEQRYKKIKTLSGGMKQRVNIAQALLNNPDILILDEPTVGLDPKERLNLKNILLEFSEEKLIIMTTHIVADIEDIADNIIIIKNGKICANNTVKDIMKANCNNVWECKLYTAEQVKEAKEKYIISQLHKSDNEFTVRIISENKPFDNAVLVEANLEEIYLNIMS